MVGYTNNEDNIPKEMTDIVKNSTEYDIGAYLYGDVDNDTEKELLAAYLDMSAGQWKIIKLENDSAEAEDFLTISLSAYYDCCSLELIDLKDKIHYVVNLSMSMNTGAMGYILEDNEAGGTGSAQSFQYHLADTGRRGDYSEYLIRKQL